MTLQKSAAIQDWLKVHRTLMDDERRLAELAVLFDQGQATHDELDATHKSVIAMRELAGDVLTAALAVGRALPS
jgi:hypothetical protein